MEVPEHLAKTDSTDLLDSPDPREKLAHLVSLCHPTNLDPPAPPVPLVKTELPASLAAQAPLAPLVQLAQSALLADLVEMVSPVAPDLKAKLELPELQEALAETDNLVLRADSLAQLDLLAQPDNLVPLVAPEKTVSPADQELLAKTDFQADQDSQVDPDSQANQAKTVLTEAPAVPDSLAAQDLSVLKANLVHLVSLAALVAQGRLAPSVDPDLKVNQVRQASPAALALLDLREDPDLKVARDPLAKTELLVAQDLPDRLELQELPVV